MTKPRMDRGTEDWETANGRANDFSFSHAGGSANRVIPDIPIDRSAIQKSFWSFSSRLFASIRGSLNLASIRGFVISSLARGKFKPQINTKLANANSTVFYWLISSLLLLFRCASSFAVPYQMVSPSTEIAQCRQLILVRVPSWKSTTGDLQLLERNRVGKWIPVRPGFPCVLGKRG